MLYKTQQTVETNNTEKREMRIVLKKTAAFFFLTDFTPRNLDLSCAGTNLTPCLAFGLQTKSKELTKKKKTLQISCNWSIHCSGSMFSRDTYSGRVEKGWALSLCRPATGNWCVEISPAADIQFEKTHLYNTCTTQAIKAWLFYNDFLYSHCEKVFSEMCDRAITACQ